VAEQSGLTDWRGNPIEVGTRVIWKEGTTSSGKWKVGVVVNIRKPDYGPVVLDLDWEETSSTWWKGNMKGRGVLPSNVTVWPEPVDIIIHHAYPDDRKGEADEQP
jgi:hypothetical protein